MPFSGSKKIFIKIIDKIEAYVKTDMRYLLKGGFWISANQVIASLRAFILSIAFANFIPRETYGQYKYVLAIFAVLSIFTLPGIRVAVTRAVARGCEGVMYLALKNKIKISMFASALSILVATFFFYQNNHVLGYSLIIVAIFIPFVDSFNLYINFLQGRKKFEAMTKYQLITETVAAISLFLILLLTNNLLLILLAFFLPYTVIRYVLWKYTSRKFNYNNNQDNGALAYAKHLSGINALATLAAQFDKILLMNFLGSAPLAQFSMASAVPAQIQSQVKILNTLALPKFSEKDSVQIKNSLFLKIIKGMALLIPIIILYIICAPYLFQILFPNYMDAVLYSQLFSVTIVFAPQRLFLTYFQAFEKKRELYVVNIISPIIRIIIFFILIPFYGIIGAILALIIEQIMNFCILGYLFRKS